ncbi:kinase [Deinococcus cellulosilyticus]|uniref:Kinase n=1 Tax=Deinococcus cellulosilyticus (strain DSM 18568 / NBRC 106333 / KACC 11606 / 5516J-15) TaxID=1223518 RepID=A0A511N0G4_DEIC1|nr:kinase [Deinococcus cellulosilyticus]GEM45958.1 hypothetical protein DC3_15930 [Deinococcus cellulosilyticus NBRC 106333 = KACC 11606]
MEAEIPKLMVLRGNSGSGKSTTARALREKLGRGVAWIEQDHFRRIVLREHDLPGGVNIGLIDLNVRYALSHGYHVILEGIFHRERYAEMLTQLYRDHPAQSFFYYFDLDFEETVRRHATRPQATEFTPEMMQTWYTRKDLLPDVPETMLHSHLTLEDTLQKILRDTGLGPAESPAR